MNGPKNETAIRAAKTLLHYTKIASDVLGLKVKEPEVQPEPERLMTPEELLEEHRKEIAELEKMIEQRGRAPQKPLAQLPAP